MSDPRGPAPASGRTGRPAAVPADPRRGNEPDLPRLPPGSTRVWRGGAAGRGVEIGSLPPRWFPADRDKLIYLAIAAHAGPRVLSLLVKLREDAWFEDQAALSQVVDPPPEPTA